MSVDDAAAGFCEQGYRLADHVPRKCPLCNGELRVVRYVDYTLQFVVEDDGSLTFDGDGYGDDHGLILIHCTRWGCGWQGNLAEEEPGFLSLIWTDD